MALNLGARVCCKTCIYKGEVSFIDKHTRQPRSMDVCRRNPPVLTYNEKSRWPQIDAIKDWCGEYKKIIP